MPKDDSRKFTCNEYRQVATLISIWPIGNKSFSCLMYLCNLKVRTSVTRLRNRQVEGCMQ